MLGLVARADQRGIGIMTAEFYKAMHPDKVLVVSHGQWPQNFEQYGNGNYAAVVDLNMKDLSLDEQTCRDFLEGLDVVYCVETLYDWRFKQWAEDAGCRVVIHGMPELYATEDHARGRPQPDLWLWPTPWLVDDGVLPVGKVLPVPCIERPNVAADPDDDCLYVVHSEGVRAAADRNGTLEFMEALRYVNERVHATIYTQDPNGLPRELPTYRKNISLDVRAGGVDDRWKMYENQHVLVLPRKYGGLCLPALEAQACAVSVVLPDVPPNDIWPGQRIATQGTQGHRAPYGFVPSAIVSARQVATVIDRLAVHRWGLGDDMRHAYGWANANCWDRWLPDYQKVLS